MRPEIRRPSPESKHKVEAGTGLVIGADEDSKRDTQQEGRKPAKMRSSVACARCRRSKIKCVNSGTNTVCVACHQNNRECTYPPPSAASSSTAKRSEHPSGTGPDGEGEVKRPRRREADHAGKQNHRNSEDPLENPPITPKLWREIYDVFMLHYSAELSFMHKATFFDRIRKMGETGVPSQDTQLFLLGVLCLTAKFVPELSSYRDSSDALQRPYARTGNPLAASEYYAYMLTTRLDMFTVTTPSLDVLQALIMVGFHNWGMNRGVRSWVMLGTAVRLATAMGLNLEEKYADSSRLTSISKDEVERPGVKQRSVEASHSLDSAASVETTMREIRRRTMWSCFILDRYFSSGRSRPYMDIDSICIQLPCSDVDFQFCRNVKTEFLYPQADILQDDDMAVTGQALQAGSSSMLNMYIRLVELWGRISKWSCAGGRRQERYIPPWDEHTEFFRLCKQLDDFDKALPIDMTFSSENLAAHAQGTSITVYTAIHTLHSLCKIVLHREYIPFIPLRCKRPVGPLDEPIFPSDKFKIPKDWWEESAEQIFKAAKDIMEIVSANSRRWVLSESPQVAFTVWTAAFVGIYSTKFPWMDTYGYMDSKDVKRSSSDDSEAFNGATKSAMDTLTEMSSRLKMASGWCKTIKRMYTYFTGVVHDYNRIHTSVSQPRNHIIPLSGERRLSVRDGGIGGGLEEYKYFEKELKDFGNIQEEERHSTPPASDIDESRASTSAPFMTPNMKTETIKSTSHSTSESTWAAVNNNTSNGDLARRASYSLNGPSHTPTNGVQDLAHYHQHQQQQSQLHDITSSSPNLGSVPQNSIYLSSSYNDPELGHVPQQGLYQFSHQMVSPGYPNSTQHIFRQHQSADPEDWAFEGQLSGVPAWEWPSNGEMNFYEMNMPVNMQNAMSY